MWFGFLRSDFGKEWRYGHIKLNMNCSGHPSWSKAQTIITTFPILVWPGTFFHPVPCISLLNDYEIKKTRTHCSICFWPQQMISAASALQRSHYRTLYVCGKKTPPEGCSFIICRLKSLHDSVEGMCSAGSSNVNILHPPSYSPVPGPGIPLPSNGRLAPTLFLFLLHTNTDLLSFCPYATASKTVHFLPFLTCHIHFLLSSPYFSLPSLPFHLIFSPSSTTLHLSLSLSLSLSLCVCVCLPLSLSCSLIWVYLHGRA